MKQNLLFNQASALGKRLAMVLTMLFTLGVGSMLGAEDSYSCTNTSGSTSPITGTSTSGCFTVKFEKNNASSWRSATEQHWRLYSGSKVTITPESGITISQIMITTTSNDYATAGKNATWTNAIATASSSTITVTPTNGDQSVTCVPSAQTRWTKITITYESATPKQEYTLSYQAGENNGALQVEEGANLLDALGELGTPTSCDATSTTFVGWTTTEITEKTNTAPTLITNSDVMPSADFAVFAVFAENSGGTSFDGTTGGNFKIYAIVKGTKFYAKGTGSKISSTTEESDATEYTFAKTSTGFTIKTGTSYITYSSSTNLGTSTTAYNWDISEGTNGSWRIASVASTARGIVFRAGSSYNQFGGYALSNVSAGSTEYFDVEIGSSPSYSNFITSCTTKTVYSVTYDSNGATSGSIPKDNNEYTANSSVTVLGNTGDLAKTGYTFIGWNTQADGNGTAYQSGKTFIITKKTTLYAQWQANTYKVSFNANGGDGTMSDQNFTYDEAKKALSKNTFTRTGYTFNGWNTQDNGQGTTYTNQQSVNNLTTENNATITLYAQWKIQTFTVTFNSNGGTGTMTSQTFTYNQAQTLTANAFTRTGYTFNGWNTKSDGSGYSYTDKQSITLTTAGLTLYAQWKANTYTVKFDGNGSDSGSMNDQSFTYGQSQNLTANAYSRANYTFKNWNTKADGSGKNYTDEQSVSNLTSENGAIITLYAQWTPVYTITWMVSGQVYHTQSAVEGTILEIPSAPNAATYACNDKVFVGWTENQIAGNTNTKPTDLFTSKSSTLTTNATYYAVFADVEGVASTDYEKITDASDLTDGKYVIAYGYNTTTPSIILEATTKDATTLVATSASPSSNKYQNPAAENIWTIKKNGTTYTLYNETTSKYVQANTTPALLLSDANPTNFVIESLDSYWKIKISDYTSYQLVGYTNSSGNYFQTKSGVSANYKIQLYKNTSTQRFFNYSTNCIMTYVISFDLKGHGLDQKPEEQIVEENGTVTEPSPAPKAEGYDFGGWFTDSECTSPYDFSSPVTASFTLYAKWTAIEYTITYDNLNGGNNDANPKTYTIESETITLKNLDDTNTHHFVGWYDEDDNLVTKIPQGSTGDITLYAKWVEIFTVKWYANGKELTNGELGSASTIVYEGEHISNLPPSGNLNNYCGDFVGWTDAEMDVNNVAKPNNLYTQASEFPNATGNQEFFAVFAE